MLTESGAIGALNLYDDSVRAWTTGDLQIAAVLADIATGYVVHASQLQKQRDLASHLQQALDSRIIIEQAKGVLANAYSTSVDEAFARLRRHARNHNARVSDVASAVVNLGLRP
jgi:AmiR/NasT family two-component response regulator